MDESVGALLDTIDGALKEIKVSVTSVKGCLSALPNQVTDLENRMKEADERIADTEDSHGAYGTSITTMEKK